MRPSIFLKNLSKRAPGITGALFCLAVALGSFSCGKKESTPDWNSSADGDTKVSEAARPAAISDATPDATPDTESSPKPASQPKTPVSATARQSSEGLRFIAYNVENWLTMDRYIDRKSLKNSPKPDDEKQAVIEILAGNSPDVIGLSEIGDARDLADIQESLKAAGLDLPHLHFTGGSDPVRHLGLLSRFPITSTAKPAESEFQLNGKPYSIGRGILDASIEARGKPYRFLGVHLKSKREVEYADQEQLRINEARLLRRHIDSILEGDAGARLVVYGDFNDTRPSIAFKTVTGSYNSPGYITAIPFKDSQGHAWTHYWNYQDIYSRIDFVGVTAALRPEVEFETSHIIDDPLWEKASDHRALLTIFK